MIRRLEFIVTNSVRYDAGAGYNASRVRVMSFAIGNLKFTNNDLRVPPEGKPPA
jgi:hypothetical protein